MGEDPSLLCRRSQFIIVNIITYQSTRCGNARIQRTTCVHHTDHLFQISHPESPESSAKLKPFLFSDLKSHPTPRRDIIRDIVSSHGLGFQPSRWTFTMKWDLCHVSCGSYPNLKGLFTLKCYHSTTVKLLFQPIELLPDQVVVVHRTGCNNKYWIIQRCLLHVKTHLALASLCRWQAPMMFYGTLHYQPRAVSVAHQDNCNGYSNPGLKDASSARLQKKNRT